MEIGGNGIHGASAPWVVILEQDLEQDYVMILRKLELALTVLVITKNGGIVIPNRVIVSKRLRGYFISNLIFSTKVSVNHFLFDILFLYTTTITTNWMENHDVTYGINLNYANTN